MDFVNLVLCYVLHGYMNDGRDLPREEATELQPIRYVCKMMKISIRHALKMDELTFILTELWSSELYET